MRLSICLLPSYCYWYAELSMIITFVKLFEVGGEGERRLRGLRGWWALNLAGEDFLFEVLGAWERLVLLGIRRREVLVRVSVGTVEDGFILVGKETIWIIFAGLIGELIELSFVCGDYDSFVSVEWQVCIRQCLLWWLEIVDGLLFDELFLSIASKNCH